MPARLVAILIIIAILFVIYVWHNVVKRKLMIKYALLWLLFSLSMIVAVLIPDVLQTVCNAVGIKTVSNFIFYLGFGLLLFITFVLTEIVSDQKTKIASLAQEVAILKHQGRK